VPRGADALLCVRRSFERAREESEFPNIQPMKSFREAVPLLPAASNGKVLHIEMELVPLAHLARFRKHFPSPDVAPLDATIAAERAVKSLYELAIMERAGEIHRRILEEFVPGLLREGMSEAELGCELYSLMVREGHQGSALAKTRFTRPVSTGRADAGASVRRRRFWAAASENSAKATSYS